MQEKSRTKKCAKAHQLQEVYLPNIIWVLVPQLEVSSTVEINEACPTTLSGIRLAGDSASPTKHNVLICLDSMVLSKQGAA